MRYDSPVPESLELKEEKRKTFAIACGEEQYRLIRLLSPRDIRIALVRVALEETEQPAPE